MHKGKELVPWRDKQIDKFQAKPTKGTEDAPLQNYRLKRNCLQKTPMKSRGLLGNTLKIYSKIQKMYSENLGERINS